MYVMSDLFICSLPNLTQDDMLRADHQQVAFKLPTYFLLYTVVHVWGVIWIELIDEDLLRQLNSKTVSVDGDLLHQLTALDPYWEKKEIKQKLTSGSSDKSLIITPEACC